MRRLQVWITNITASRRRSSSCCDFHEPNMKISCTIAPSIAKALKKYQEHNGFLPERVIMYR